MKDSIVLVLHLKPIYMACMPEGETHALFSPWKEHLLFSPLTGFFLTATSIGTRNWIINIKNPKETVQWALSRLNTQVELRRGEKGGLFSFHSPLLVSYFCGLEVSIEWVSCSPGFVYGSLVVYYKASSGLERCGRCFISCQGLLQLN